ncbi:Quino protein amine dehydrogenase [Xylaria castorea]|nr:Quino protein amine dehydrogenase [Xylaria castorea]
MQELHESKSAELEGRLEKEWQKRISQPPPNLQDKNSYNSTTDTIKHPEPSLQLPARVQIRCLVSRDWQHIHHQHKNYSVRISPDGSCFGVGPFKDGIAVLFSTDTGRETERYTHPTEGSRLWPIAFSSDGQALALDNYNAKVERKDILIARRGERRLQVWHTFSKFSSFLSVISTDFETTIDFLSRELVLISPAKTNQILERTSLEKRYSEPTFAKQDQIVICYGDGNLYFWETRHGRLLHTVRITDVHPHAFIRQTSLTVSPNSFWLAFTTKQVERNRYYTTSFFRLSGSLPELITTVQYESCSWNSASLSFDGTYFAVISGGSGSCYISCFDG